MSGLRRFWKVHRGWILTGLLVSLAAGAIYSMNYGYFRRQAKLVATENVFSRSECAEWIRDNTYQLYYDLHRGETDSFADFYVKPSEELPWMSRELVDRYTAGSDLAIQDDLKKIMEETGLEETEILFLLDAFQEAYMAVEEESSWLSGNYGAFSGQFDYRITDLDSGVAVSNVRADQDLFEGAYWGVCLDLDERGYARVVSVTGDKSSETESHMDAAFHGNPDYALSARVSGSNLGRYLQKQVPRSCRIEIAVSAEKWAKCRNVGFVEFDAAIFPVQSEYRRFLDTGAGLLLMALQFIVVLAAIFAPWDKRIFHRMRRGGETATEAHTEPDMLVAAGTHGEPDAHVAAQTSAEPDDWRNSRLCRLPLIALAALAFWSVVFFAERVVITAVWVCNDNVRTQLRQAFGRRLFADLYLMAYNMIILLLFFFFAWYIGVNLRPIRRLGVRAYLRERCVVLPWIKGKWKRLIAGMTEFSLTEPVDRQARKIVIFNGVAMALFAATWLFGWIFVVIYSVALYLFLRKYLSGFQEQYKLLLRATSEIARGNLEGAFQEDLGMFEPFKPELAKIQTDFRRAVDEEVKSQRMKAELITNVSHDLKTPLTAIITYISLLKEEGPDGERREEYLNTLEQKSLRLKALIEDLFEVSKADSRNVTLNRVDVDIVNLIKQVTVELQDKLDEANLTLRTNFPKERVGLFLDSQKTYRIFENLFGNIVKYAMPGSRVYVDVTEDAETVKILLRNTSAEELTVAGEELTERFVRGDASRGRTEGSGLGLAIARSFTQLQGGKMSVEIDGDLFKVTVEFPV